MTDGDIVYTEEVASLQEMVGELAVLRKLVFERRTQDVAGNAVAAIECIQGVGSSHIVIDIETEATVSVDAQIPILVGQTGGQTAIVRGLGTLTSDVLVRVFFARSDGAVFGNVFTVQRLSVFVISLLLVGIRSLSYHVYLQIAACTSGVTCLYVVALVVDGVQLGNL